MVSPIRTNSVLQSYIANKSQPDSKTLDPTQSNATSLERASTASSKVIFSQAAREKLELSLSINSYHQQMSDIKKDRARERAAEIKQRVDELKGLITLLGPSAPKALLRELKQLANQLKRIAVELKEAWSGTTGTNINEGSTAPASEKSEQLAPQLGETSSDTNKIDRNKIAKTEIEKTKMERTKKELTETAQKSISHPSKQPGAANDKNKTSQSDTSPVNAFSQQTNTAQSKQRSDDQRLLQETARELKSLFNRLKALLRKEDHDQQTQKQLAETEKLLTDTNTIAGQLTSSTNLTMPGLNIAISV